MNHLDDILKLLDALAALPFETVEVSTADVTVRVGRGYASAQPAPRPPLEAQTPENPPAPAAPAQPQGRQPVAVTSPIIGMFYGSPSPEEPPFVRVGERVKAGQTLCIVEAMKLMNEIPSPVSGTVVEVLAGDGGEVEVGQTLFLVDAGEN